MGLTVLVWNLFHGRAVPGARRALLSEFSGQIASWEWDVALLQEVPPWWPPLLAEQAGATHCTALTSRNSLLTARRAVARRWPDAIKSNGGGANAVLVRGELGEIVEHRRLRLRRWPERRVAQLVRTSSGVCVVNLHASTRPTRASAELALLWRETLDWAADARLLLGGDLNLRSVAAPRSDVVHVAEHRVDHLFARGLGDTQRVRVLEPAIGGEHGGLTLSDHRALIVELAVAQPRA